MASARYTKRSYRTVIVTEPSRLVATKYLGYRPRRMKRELILRSSWILAIVLLASCAHSPCGPGSVLKPGERLRDRSRRDGEPICIDSSSPTLVGRWGSSSNRSLHLALGSRFVATARGEPLFLLAGACRDGRRELPEEVERFRLQQAILGFSPKSVAIDVLDDSTEVEAIRLGRALSHEGIEVSLRTVETPASPCEDLVDAHKRAHPSPSTNTGTTAVAPSSLKKADISDAIGARLGVIKQCYQSQLDVRPWLGGMVAFRFIIDPQGRVGEMELAIDTVSSRVSDCVAKILRTITFPPPNGGGIVIVTYPFVFASK